ncbi:MAG: ABC transporter transmembrane domain-containing protein, partial [Pseudomonadota bacterium]
MTRGTSSGPTLVALLLPLFWPRGRWDLRAQIGFAFLCLVGAKVAVVTVPVLFKYIVDAASPETQAALSAVGLIGLYALARFSSVFLTQIREIAFVRPARYATRTLSLEGLRQVHALGAPYVTGKPVGTLAQIVQNGVNGLRQILEYLIFSLGPTILELVMVIAVLWVLLDGSLALILATLIVAYIAFTVIITEWRAE